MDAPRSPLPSDRDVSDVMARMDQFRQAGRETKSEKDAGGSGPLVTLSCVLSGAGIILLAFTLCVVCAPTSVPAQMIISACETLF